VSPEECYDRLVDSLTAHPEVTPPSPGGTFGSAGLKVNGKIFAMLVRGEFVVKLPRRRVTELIAAGQGRPFDANKGRPMAEWLVANADCDWHQLAEEALKYVRRSERCSRQRCRVRPANSR
jgi:TfoX/Sxy family transcriptional regulator of competence genes